MSEPAEITVLLNASADGDENARSELLNLVYADLKRIAAAQLGARGGYQTLSPTALVHEAYIKLVHKTGGNWADRKHFFRVVSKAMRMISVDYARARFAKKRGSGKVAETFDDNISGDHGDYEQVIDIDNALRRLEDENPRWVRVVECRYFAGLTADETADTLEISLRTVHREWKSAKAWLKSSLSG